MSNNLEALTIKVFMDGAEIGPMREAVENPMIKGFTTNPTLMRKAGISNYEEFAKEAITAIPDMPISFEVFSDDLEGMEREARKIASWGGNTYIKIPVTNTKGQSTAPLITKLSAEGLSINVTAILTLRQVIEMAQALHSQSRSIISIFAGRIADTGIDPVPMMAAAREIIRPLPKAELLWASPRELLNIFHAQSCGCHIITATSDVLKKLSLVGKDLEKYSLETVEMFYRDALAAGYRI